MNTFTKILLPITAVALLNASTFSFSMNIFNAIGKGLKANGDVNRVKELIEVEQIDVNITNEKGDTPLHLACFFNNIKIIKLLLPKCDATTINNDGKLNITPLNIACWKNSPQIVDLLLRYGANIDEDSLSEAPNKPEILRLLNLAQDLDNSENKLWFIENQTNNADQDFLRERLSRKYFIDRIERTRTKILLDKKKEESSFFIKYIVNFDESKTTKLFNFVI